MKREEVLAKSRGSNNDEREEQIRDKSFKWTFITMVIVSAVFAYIRTSKGESIYDLPVIVCSSVAVSHLYRYYMTKRKDFFILGLVTLAAAVFALVMFYMGR